MEDTRLVIERFVSVSVSGNNHKKKSFCSDACEWHIVVLMGAFVVVFFFFFLMFLKLIFVPGRFRSTFRGELIYIIFCYQSLLSENSFFPKEAATIY